MLLGIACLLLGISSRPAAAGDFPPSSLVLTNISQLRQGAGSNRSAACTFRIAGSVLWIGPARDQLILQDGSAGIRVQLDLRSYPALALGQKISLQGSGWLGRDGLRAALVNNDDLHPAVERNESAYLEKGRHPVEVDWFNASGFFALEVAGQAPGQPRGPIANAALSRAVVTADGTTNWVAGLDYAGYLGAWTQLPKFADLAPSQTGTISNFSLSIRPRDTDVGLRFRGFFEAPESGVYTFWLKSDDGSQLLMDNLSFRLALEPGNELPPAQQLFADQPLALEQDCCWSTAEGTVTFIAEREGFLDLELDSGTGVMHVYVAGTPWEYAQMLLGNRARVTGASQSTFTVDGQRVAGVVLVSGINQIEVVQAAPALWNTRPSITIGELMAGHSGNASPAVVHIGGAVRAVGPDGSLWVDDGSGKIQVQTGQPFTGNVGEVVDVLAAREQTVTNLFLTGGIFREMAPAKKGGPAGLPVLTTVGQVKSLTREKAQKGYPVRVRGIVTAPFNTGFFIQDGTWAIYVRSEGMVLSDLPRTGDYWEVEGTTYAEFSPNIQAHRALRLGPGIMPEPLQPTADQFANGSLDTRYVEIVGVATETGSDHLVMLTPEGRIQVQLSDVDPTFGPQSDLDLRQFENASIRVRGCAIPARDTTTQQIPLGNSWVWLANYSITVDNPAPANPFAAPLRSVADLRQFNPHASILARVKVAGQILHRQGRECYLWDGTNGLRFVSQHRLAADLGDMVEVVGFPDLTGSSLVLREAMARRTGHADLPAPRSLSQAQLGSRTYDSNSRFRPQEPLIDHSYEGSLVRIQANLTDISTESSGRILTLQAGSRGFVARLNGRPELSRDILPGSRVELTGVYASQDSGPAAPGSAASFELLLNSPQDIVVLEHPSWWNFQRLLVVLGLIMVILAGALLWIFTLRRQVHAQALMIREKVEREATLEERARIARDIHDTLEQALAGTSLQLNALAASISGVSPEPLRILTVARSMINHAQEEARRTVRNLRLLDLENHNLPTALSQFADTSRGESAVKIEVTVNGLYKPLPGQVENHLLRIGQEAVTNAVKHAGARTIQIELNCATDSLRLSVRDDGCGFSTTNVSGAAAGHFGLLGMRERAEKMGGSLQVVSQPGQGTTVTVTLATPVQMSDEAGASHLLSKLNQHEKSDPNSHR